MSKNDVLIVENVTISYQINVDERTFGALKTMIGKMREPEMKQILERSGMSYEQATYEARLLFELYGKFERAHK